MHENPYEPPSSGAMPDAQAGSQDYPLLAFALLFPTVVASGALIVVPEFAGVFKGFGDELPAETRILLATYRYWLGLPFILALVWLLGPRERVRHLALMGTSLVLAAVMFLYGLWSCYSPIFRSAANI